MVYFRLFNHALRTPMVLLGLCEMLLFYFVALAAIELASAMGASDVTGGQTFAAGLFALGATLSALAMGLYNTGLREGMVGILLRWTVALFLLTVGGLTMLHVVVPGFTFEPGRVALAAVTALPAALVARFTLARVFNPEVFRRRVLFLGAGKQALRINQRMRRRADRRGFELLGFLPVGGEDLVSSHGAMIVDLEGRTLFEYCHDNAVDEIVIAADDRRAGGLAQFPQEALLDCKLSGIHTTDVLEFYERESKRIDIDILRPGWLLAAAGFRQDPVRRTNKRACDILKSGVLLALVWPLMLLTALAIKLEDGWRAPILYRQRRIGLRGQPYDLLKFRSMRADAEAGSGAMWAQKDDPRITRVGRIIRPVRIDELPQLFNVLQGTMSFVGPRPERPEFVEELQRTIPFYRERHRMKPGITGWAQIHYPYGSSDEDAKAKLEYDLYYVKNHSMLLDFLIMLRTVEVVLLGNGAR